MRHKLRHGTSSSQDDILLRTGLENALAQTPSRQTQWKGFLRRTVPDRPKVEQSEVVNTICAFPSPILAGIIASDPFGAGMLRDFHRGRWELLLQRLQASLAANTPWDPEAWQTELTPAICNVIPLMVFMRVYRYKPSKTLFFECPSTETPTRNPFNA